MCVYPCRSYWILLYEVESLQALRAGGLTAPDTSDFALLVPRCSVSESVPCQCQSRCAPSPAPAPSTIKEAPGLRRSFRLWLCCYGLSSVEGQRLDPPCSEEGSKREPRCCCRTCPLCIRSPEMPTLRLMTPLSVSKNAAFLSSHAPARSPPHPAAPNKLPNILGGVYCSSARASCNQFPGG